MDNFRTSSVPNHHFPKRVQRQSPSTKKNIITYNNNKNNLNNKNNNNSVSPIFSSNPLNRLNNSLVSNEGYQQSQMISPLEDIEEVSRTNENQKQNISVILTINPNKGGKPAKKIKLAGLSGLLFFVYSAILVTLAINNSIVEVYHTEKTEIIFRTVFSIYINGVAAILYILIEIDQYSKKKKRRSHSKKPLTIQENEKIESYGTNQDYYEKDFSEKNARIEFKSSKRKSSIQEEEIKGYLKINNTTKYFKQSPSITDLTPDDVFLSDIPKVEEEEEIVEDVFMDLSRLGTIFNHHGSSFFLRIGTLLFGVGHIIYIIFEMMSQIGAGTECTFLNHWGALVVRLIFVVIQMFSLFKNPQFIINRKTALWHKASFVHIMTTNVCIWLNTLTSEIDLETKSLGYKNASNASVYSACNLMDTASPYLFPFILEYCLLCVSIVAVLYFSLKEEDKTKVERGISNLFKIDVFDDEKSLDDKSETASHSEELFSKSHRGIFFGCLLLAANIICIILFRTAIKFYSSSDHGASHVAEILYLSVEFVTHLILLVLATIALVKIDELSFIGKPRSIDDLLIYLAFTGSLMYNIALVNSSVFVFSSSSDYCMKVEVMRIVQSLCAILQQIIQVGLVSSGLRRYPSKTSQVVNKPGRTCLTFLVIGNITAWIYHSTLSKSHSLQTTPIKLYGELPWIVLSNITLPLQLFFYFHSSVCLAEIWHTAYHVIKDHSYKSHNADSRSQNTEGDNTPPFLSAANQRRNSDAYNQDVKQISSIIRSVSVSQLSSKPRRTFKDYNDRRRFSSNKHIPANAQLKSIEEYENYSFYM